MLIMGAIFNCVDPILTVVAGLSVRDPFLMPIDKKDLAEQNLLSAPTLKDIDSLRKEFFSPIKDTGLVHDDPDVYNGWSNAGDLI
ncbi:Dexh-box atp-dependent rna helicase dexh3 [Thalictrum thalictroides]|uniref:Dexh-box atp-dependent rna helicase dexh3 n=1 Tax=Thalictrum thalictroides TaxID=46969 RepID=A0A7J6VQR3_THATH|nr:Dexh-box atp-dependent rna helicase dexh3 [Thalictrum thalictroides]